MLEYDTDGSGAAVLAALARLAAAVAAELVAGGLSIVGVTGSSGKTSTKDLLAAVLEPLGAVVAPPGSFNNELGHPWTVLRATTDTDYLILEMSARHPGNIAALARIAPPSIAVVLNVGTAHLGEFGSREAIAATKAELPQAVPASGRGDPQRRRRGGGRDGGHDRGPRGPRRPLAGADVWADDVVLDELARPRFTLHAAGGADRRRRWPCTVTTRCPTRCARRPSRWSAARPSTRWRDALAAAGPVSRHRMQVGTRADGVTVINDAYNANPDSMRAGLKALAWMAEADRSGRRRAAPELGRAGRDGRTR